MNAKAFNRLERLAEGCALVLKQPQRQTMTISRGDMWAIVGAHHDIRKARQKSADHRGTLAPAEKEE